MAHLHSKIMKLQCDFTDLDKAFSIFIGNSNDHDVEYDLIDTDFMER